MFIFRKDNKKCVRHLFSAFFALLAFCFTSLILTQENNALAVSDISHTWPANSSMSAWSDYIPDCSTTSCLSQYRYLIVEQDISYPLSYCQNCSISISFRSPYTKFGSSVYTKTINFSASQPYSILDLGFNTDSSFSDNLFQSNSQIDFVFDTTFTLTENLPGSGSIPSGSITLTENGTFDVTNYAEAVVDVPVEVLPGDYDDEFNGVITAIYICGASVIMLYFFYIIYGIIIKPTGGYK